MTETGAIDAAEMRLTGEAARVGDILDRVSATTQQFVGSAQTGLG